MSLKEWFGKGPKGDWVDIGAPKKKASSKPVDVNLRNQAKENIQSVCHVLKPRV